MCVDIVRQLGQLTNIFDNRDWHGLGHLHMLTDWNSRSIMMLYVSSMDSMIQSFASIPVATPITTQTLLKTSSRVTQVYAMCPSIAVTTRDRSCNNMVSEE